MRFHVLSRISVVIVMLIAAHVSGAAQSITWVPTNGPTGVTGAMDLEIAPWGDLYLLIPGSIYRSSDDGISWSKCLLEPPAGFLAYDMAIDSSGNILAGGHGNNNGSRLFRSIDRGNSWSAVASYNGTSARAIAVGPQGEYYVGGPSAALQRSTDAGATWSILKLNAVMTQNLAVLQSGTILAGGSGASSRSTDGTIWETVAIGLSGIRPYNGDTVLALSALGSGIGFELRRSVDGGKEWDVANVPAVTNPYTGIFVAGNRSLIASVLEDGMYSSTDLGATWNRLATGLPRPVTHLVETGNGILVAAGPTGPYRSEDGINWQPGQNGLTEVSITTLFASRSGSILA
jgi:photosystem II stability/assembly factor-like uncharacterized protein